MKKMLPLAGAAALVSAVFGYSVAMTGSPDATATGAATASAGWAGRAATASEGATRDLRQTTWAESAAWAKTFDSRRPSGFMVFVR